MKRVLTLTAVALLAATGSVQAQVLTFDEPRSNQAMTHVCSVCTRTQYSSPPAEAWAFGEVSLTALGSTVLLRSTFDDRSPSPSPYRFIDRNVAQISGSQLRLDFPNGTDRFGFGAALNGTSAPAQMTVDITGTDGSVLGQHTVSLQRTSNTNGNTNSEGVFFVAGVGEIRSVTITNLGDPLVPASANHWVIDNIQYALRGATGSQGPQGPKGDPGAPAALPTGMLLYLLQGSPAPNGLLFLGRVGGIDLYIKL